MRFLIKPGAGLQWILSIIPCAILAGYAWFVMESYSGYLDWHLKYHRPAIEPVPEDVLGFGFLPSWLFFSLLFIFSLLAVLSALERRIRYAAVLSAMFAALSALDFFLYRTLERQVLGL